MDFNGVKVLVVGCASDIGMSLCQILKKYNALVIGSFHEKKADLDISQYQCDVTNEKSVESLFNEIKKQYGFLDAVINMTCLCEDCAYYEKSEESFRKVIDVNLLGTFLVCKYASFLVRKNGVIINMSSTDGIDTFNEYSIDYCASKAGVNNLTQNLALAIKDKRIMALCPMWVDTKSVKQMEQNFLNEELLKHDQKELLHKEDVALKVIEMMINEEDYKTGQIIRMEKNYE